MKALDLFSGAASGWTLGLHRAGIETVAACEADPWRRAVYGQRWPGVKLYDDVRTLTGERVLADVGAVQLVCGSPPCQDASAANPKGKGIDGERTGLFRDAVRLVRELRPDWVCFENVPGIRTCGADWIIGALEEAGYSVWPLVVGAVHAGAPHRRQRVWFLAYAGAAGHERRSAAEWSERQPWAKPAGSASADAHEIRRQSGAVPWQGRPEAVGCGEGIARDPDSARLAQREGIGGDARAELPAAVRAIGEAWPCWNGGIAGIGGLDDGLPRGVARAALAAYGDAVCPQITEAIGRAILGIDAARRLAA